MFKRKRSEQNLQAMLIEKDKAAALNMLSTANIADPINLHFLLSFSETTLAKISVVMATFAIKKMLNDQTRELIALAGHHCAWEVCDLYIRFHHAKCLTNHTLSALHLACKTSFLSVTPKLIQKNVCDILASRFFNKLFLEQKIELCTLALALPSEIKMIVDVLTIFREKKLLSDHVFSKIMEVGFLFAANHINHEEFSILRKREFLEMTNADEIMNLLQIPRKMEAPDSRLFESNHPLFEMPPQEEQHPAPRKENNFGCHMM